MALVYSCVTLVALCGMASLAVDFGRVRAVQSDLRSAADAAARAGATDLGTSNKQAVASAVAAGALNTADGQSVTLDSSLDVILGTWDETKRIFSAGSTGANAVSVTARRVASRGTAVPTGFAAMVGRASCDVQVTTIAFRTSNPAPSNVTNKSNPWLAGMPDGTKANGYDSAPSASPTLLISSGLTSGATLTMDATGATSNQAGSEKEYEPDGNLGWIIYNYGGAENGIANLNAPISSLIGVFLDDNQPNKTAAPKGLDFTSSKSRDFDKLSPLLKQPFFIGDAKKADGTAQEFVVPVGATRLFVGSMDGQQWSDNAGGFSVTVNGLQVYRVVTVK